MAQSLPKLFKPKFSDKDFQKKILKKIFIPKARELVLKIYKQDSDGSWVLNEAYATKPLTIDKKEFKAIQTLAKEIQKNSGIFDFSKLILVGLVAAGLFVFVTFFLDGLVRRLTIDALQAIFGARVDISSMYVRPWEGKIYFSGLEIADRENPMTNLVEFKDLQVDVDLGALFGGSVLLNRIVAREMNFGTPRSYSGQLDPSPQPKTDEVQDGTTNTAQESQQPSVDFGALLETPLDQLPFRNLITLTKKSPKELFEEEAAKLQSVTLTQEINTKIQERQTFWQNQVTQTQNQLRTSNERVTALTRRDVRQIRDLNELRSFLDQVKQTTNDIQGLETSIRQSVDGIKSDANQINQWRNQIQEAIANDWDYLRSLISLPPGGPVGWVSALIMPEVNRRFGSQIRLARRGLEIARAIQSTSDKKEVQPKPERRGQDIPFPTARYPKFLLRLLEVSLGSRNERDLTEFLVKDISSQPDLTKKPYMLSFTRLNQNKELNVTALADLRTNASALFTAKTLMSNEPFALPETFSAAGLQNFEGLATWEAEIQFLSQNGLRLAVKSSILNPKLSWVEKNEVTDLVDRILNAANGIRANIDLKLQGADRSLTASTNLDEPAKQEIERWAREKIRQFETNLRRELDNRLAQYLNENRGLLRSFDGSIAQINQAPNQVNEFKKQLGDKQKEVEERIANWAQDSIRQNLPPVRLPF